MQCSVMSVEVAEINHPISVYHFRMRCVNKLLAYNYSYVTTNQTCLRKLKLQYDKMSVNANIDLKSSASHLIIYFIRILIHYLFKCNNK